MTANQPIESVVNHLKEDLDPNGSGWSAAYKLAASKLESHALKVGGPVSPQDLASKYLVFKAQAMAAENTTRFDVVSSELIGLASGVAEAQQNLSQVVNASDFNVENVQQFAKKVREFKSIYGLLRH